MSERSLPRALLVVACLLGGAHPAFSQSDPRAAAAARAAAERARIDSLLPLLEQTAAEVQRRREREWKAELVEEGKLDTVRVGPMLVIGRGRALDDVAALLRTVWQEYEPLLGEAGAELTGVAFLVQGDSQSALLRELSQRPRHYPISFPSVSRGDHAAIVRRAFDAPVHALLPAAVRSWIGDGHVATTEWDRVYRALAVSNSIGARHCLDGSADACAALLGLADPGADWAAWYSPLQLETLARQHRPGDGSADYHRCVVRHELDGCVAAFAAIGGPPPPLDARARGSLLHHALVHGGTGSLEGLVRDSMADARTALARAAGTSFDAVIASWQQAVSRARPNVYADLGRSLLVTLLWCGLLTTLAVRSTRWRTG